MASNEGEYMLVPHKHKINFYKTTKVRVSTDFVDTVDPYHFISFPDLLARNFDTRVAFDFLGQVVSTDHMRVIVEYGREKRLMNLVAQDLSLNALDKNVEPSSRTSQLNSDTVVANPEDYYLRFQIKNIDEIPDFNEEVGLTIIATIIGFDMDEGCYSFYCRDCSKKVTKNDDDVDAGPFHCDGYGLVSDVYGKIMIVVRVQDESGSSSFVLFERHVKDLIHRGNQWLMEKIAKDQGRQQIPDEFKILLNKKFVFKVQIYMFNLQNNYRAYTVQKLTDDEMVLAEVFKRSPNHEHHIINDNALTPSSSMGKRPIEIDVNTDSLEWSSTKTGVVSSILKIPKLEKLD
ncbi:unnamed protein product [Lactuca virosa]|uniref:Replication factor A C-terminal domain-containing protein n=1 Tax=Lactuca virosa TaxID=75947 RepID=A0AAU9N0U7_9ASTR|nr:unnamed protein product [Lactuca virosa]